ncbi:LOW protein: PPR containing protein [Thalictrum thalictroides]|uniref:LOW protein: PPR containing protein n=1 Tax=Thalictrum thalictroides TaxID=46969 RepID=A0A7J6W4Q4_THATH|nr:LOW protein: PPR containing protein [Thalictrum thalictroides]
MEDYFRIMKYKGVKPNSVTYCSLISVYSKSRELKKISWILRQVENTDVVLDQLDLRASLVATITVILFQAS